MPACSSETHLRVRRLVLFCDPPLSGSDGLLRKAVTAQLPDRALLHGHDPEGRPVASYVRYRVVDGVGHVIGWGPALELLGQIRDGLTRLRLDRSLHQIVGAELHDQVEPFGLADEALSYRSLTPWLALNQANHERYLHLTGFEDRRALLERVMVGNLLSLAKGADHWVNNRIICTLSQCQEQPVVHKDTDLLGFEVTCAMNFHLPEWLGIGKLASKGYGLFIRESNAKGF